jgi:hypothetical protein
MNTNYNESNQKQSDNQNEVYRYTCSSGAAISIKELSDPLADKTTSINELNQDQPEDISPFENQPSHDEFSVYEEDEIDTEYVYTCTVTHPQLIKLSYHEKDEEQLSKMMSCKGIDPIEETKAPNHPIEVLPYRKRNLNNLRALED